MKEELRPSRIILTLLNEKNTLGSVEKYSRETNVGNIDAAAGQTWTFWLENKNTIRDK